MDSTTSIDGVGFKELPMQELLWFQEFHRIFIGVVYKVGFHTRRDVHHLATQYHMRLD